MTEISIVLPVYFEDKNISKVISKISNKVKGNYEILIVYDLDSDPTVKVVEKIMIKNSKIKLIKNDSGTKRGVMNAIKTGFKYSKGKAVVVTMADLSDDITQINQMNELIKNGFDIVSASRYMPQGKKIGGPFLKTLMSKTAGITLHTFLKIPTHDATNAFKMYKKSVLDKIKIESTGGFEYSLEIILKAHKMGYKITEIPTIWRDREDGKSNFKLLNWLPKYIKWYLYAFRK